MLDAKIKEMQRQGIVKTLSLSEVNRGYLYICRYKRLSDILDRYNLEVEVAGHIYPSQRIDVWGRIQIGKKVLRLLGAGTRVRISFVSERKLKIEVLSASE